jgi:hypothetical protein
MGRAWRQRHHPNVTHADASALVLFAKFSLFNNL